MKEIGSLLEMNVQELVRFSQVKKDQKKNLMNGFKDEKTMAKKAAEEDSD